MTDRKGILGRSFTGAKCIAIIEKDILTGHDKFKRKQMPSGFKKKKRIKVAKKQESLTYLC